jgi:hypothetical protein
MESFVLRKKNIVTIIALLILLEVILFIFLEQAIVSKKLPIGENPKINIAEIAPAALSGKWTLIK